MYVFGGKNVETNEVFGDLWLFNIDSMIWQEVTVDDSPLMRSGHRMEVDVETNKIFVFGGASPTLANELNDLHRFDAVL
jgi:N-acetylneuraminic acid mutarotase